jgi:hypothetical protein
VETDKIDFGVLVELGEKLSVNFGQVDDIAGFLHGVKTILYDLFLKCYHLLMDGLRKGTVELLNFCYVVE